MPAHAGYLRHGELRQKGRHVLLPEDADTVGFVDIRTDLGQKLHGRRADGTRKPAGGFPDGPAHGADKPLHAGKSSPEASGIEISLVNARLLHHGRKTSQGVHDLPGNFAVAGKARRHEDAAGAEASRLRRGHGRVHAELPRLVGGRGHHAAPAAGHDDGPAPETRVVHGFHGGEERVHIHVQNHVFPPAIKKAGNGSPAGKTKPLSYRTR